MKSPSLQQQYDAYYKLRSEPYFADINVILQREKMLRSEADVKSACITKTGGKAGVAVVVGMPVVSTPDPEIGGPQVTLSPVFTVMEQADVNHGASGTGKHAEDVADELVAVLHHFYMQYFGTMYANGEFIVPNQNFTGIRAFDVTLWMRVVQSNRPRVARPTLTITNNEGTLTTTESATMYYTLDLSFPGPGNDGGHDTLIPESAVYDANGEYDLAVTERFGYYYTKGEHDTKLTNGVQELSTSGRFTAGDSVITLTGTMNKRVTARVAPAAILYTAPFDVAENDEIRWAGYKTSFCGSDTSYAKVTA
jgi:hypothetical protein